MSGPSSIVVPLDLSKRSARALDYAAEIAERFDATLVLMTNVNSRERSVLEEYANAENTTVADAAEVTLRRLGQEHAPHAEVTIEVRFNDSDAEAILATAEAVEADAIIIASHGRTGMTRWALGSVADKVARSAAVPVTIIPVRDT